MSNTKTPDPVVKTPDPVVKTPDPVVVREASPGEYPKMLYFLGDHLTQKTVESVEEEDALGEEWLDAPRAPG